MFVKDFEKPRQLEQLESLEKRLSPHEPIIANLKSDIARYTSGYIGEKTVYFHLQQLPDKDFFIFHNLRIRGSIHHFQIDFLVLTFTFGLIIETKNFLGTLHFDSQFGQMIRTNKGIEEGFDDPLTQAESHQILLTKWIQQHFDLNLPIEWLVVVSHSSTILSTDPGKAHQFKRVIHATKIPIRVQELKGKFRSTVIDKPLMKKLNRGLLKAHEPLVIDVLKRYNLTVDSIVKGVQCEKCRVLGMERKHGTWKCPKCGYIDELAHLSALKDYFNLVKGSISNKEFREFMLIQSEDVAKRLLKGLKLVEVGTKKGRRYLPPKRVSEITAKK